MAAFSREFGKLTLTARIHSSKSQGTLSPITLICQFNKKYQDAQAGSTISPPTQ